MDITSSDQMKIKLLILNLFLIGSVCFAQNDIPYKNQCVIDTVVKYGPKISSTYQKAVCTEMVIKVLEKFHYLDKTDKTRVRIITSENIQELLAKDSPVPKGVYTALIKKGVGIPIDDHKQVKPGDFVQFWTETWGHCGIVKSINLANQTMELYSSFPSTSGYGVQTFTIPKYCFFVRLK